MRYFRIENIFKRSGSVARKQEWIKEPPFEQQAPQQEQRRDQVQRHFGWAGEVHCP